MPPLYLITLLGVYKNLFHNDDILGFAVTYERVQTHTQNCRQNFLEFLFRLWYNIFTMRDWYIGIIRPSQG